MATKQPPFYLARLRVKNFRSISEADVALGPLTVLVGQNGSGKSNVVDALRFLRDCLAKGLDQAILDRGGLTVLRRWAAGGRPADISIGVTLTNDDQEVIAYDFSLSGHSQQGFSVKREELHIESTQVIPLTIALQGDTLTLVRQGKKQLKKLLVPSGSELSNRLRGPANMVTMLNHFDKLVTTKDRTSSLPESFIYERYGWTFLQSLRGSLFYTLNPVQLRAPQRLIQETPFDEAGQNLAAVLQHLRRNKRPAEEIRQTLARLITGIADFSVETTGSYLVAYLHYKNETGSTRKADLGQESDGTLRVLGILAALFQRKALIAPRYPFLQFLTIEEPEVNIHPGMLAVLAELFREASLKSQILLTTHSPDLLDFLPPDSFLVVEKVDGETQVGPLATDQAQIVRQRLFSAGELLRTEGLHRQPAALPPGTPQAA